MVSIPAGQVQQYMQDNGLEFDTVESVERTGNTEPVYDVSLMATGQLPNTFLADGIVVHNSTDPNYLSNIIKTGGYGMDIKNVFGIRDENGAWVVKPRVRYYAEGVAEKFFDYLASLERKLPDKIQINKEWFYVFDAKVSVKGKLVVNKAAYAAVGDHYDKKYLARTGKLRVPAVDGTLQAVIIVDSYPAMLPERLDVDDPGAGMAAQARMFSEQLRRVKGRLKAKRIAVVGVNQLRKAPGVMYGSPEYEPGGEALRFYSDVRLRVFPRALSGVPGNPKGKGMIEEEASIAKKGGKDTYRYIHIRAIKNKLSVPYIEGWLRLWITDCEGEARGFDPVWDTYQYLSMTGQVSGKRSNLRLALVGKETRLTISWLEFKALIAGSQEQKVSVYKKLGLKPFNLRVFCKKQLHKGPGMDLFFQHSKADLKEEEGDE